MGWTLLAKEGASGTTRLGGTAPNVTAGPSLWVDNTVGAKRNASAPFVQLSDTGTTPQVNYNSAATKHRIKLIGVTGAFGGDTLRAQVGFDSAGGSFVGGNGYELILVSGLTGMKKVTAGATTDVGGNPALTLAANCTIQLDYTPVTSTSATLDLTHTSSGGTVTSLQWVDSASPFTSGTFTGFRMPAGYAATSVEIWTFLPDVAPDAPTSISFSAVDSTSMTVTVTPASTGASLTGYKLERRVGAGAFVEVGSQAGPVFSMTGLTGATLYDYRARAFNGIGNGAYGATASQGTDNSISWGGSLPFVADPTTEISISPASVERAMQGAAVQFNASASIGGASPVPAVATWSVMSGDASINSSGLLTVGSSSGVITVRASALGAEAFATINQVTKDMDDTSIQSLRYVNGVLTGEILFTSGPGRVKITATYGGTSQEKIFGPGTSVPIAWNIGVQVQELRWFVIGLPAS